ncbi:MAG: hypothetical protein CVU56_05060 [Deltaproteobacteria bacterium HGW-Deltaproteobacteria-14]|jgi:hypothetical protein|nr:MAG: hypothetical protein CVU56_05060 [Deltaproteobacteria bacterium HGW-Deltaproteobacteria-14]
MRPVAALAIATLLAACGTSPVTAPPPAAPTTAPAAPRWRIERPTFFAAGAIDFDAFGRWSREVPLPAISEDGALVAIGSASEDGARGNPNYVVRLVEVEGGREVLKATLLDAEEVDEHVDDPGFEGVVTERVDRVNDVLAKHRWTGAGVPLDDLAGVRAEQDFGTPFVGPIGLRDAGFEVTLHEPRLRVRHEGRVLVDRDYPAWSVPAEDVCGAADRESIPDAEEACVCHNPVTLRGGRVDLDRGVLLLDIGYLGTDICWEPDSWTAVVALGK